MKSSIQDKSKLVNSVFSSVHKKYDLMNDIMSLGIHRIWKKKFLDWINPIPNSSLIDVASGTGDIAKLFSLRTKNLSKIDCVEPNENMFSIGKNNLKNFKNIKWHKTSAENLPFKENSFDFYTISFGLRNTRNLNKSLAEAYRVLKPGGRYLCLEFSKIQNSNLDFIYKSYSKLIPIVGDLVVGQKEPYEYLVKSIEKFINQEELIDLMKNNKLQKCSYRNFTGGIVSIHSGWKF